MDSNPVDVAIATDLLGVKSLASNRSHACMIIISDLKSDWVSSPADSDGKVVEYNIRVYIH